MPVRSSAPVMRARDDRYSAYLPIALALLTLWTFLQWQFFQWASHLLDQATRVVSGPLA